MAQSMKKTWKLGKEDQFDWLIGTPEINVTICGGMFQFQFQICEFLAELWM